MEGQYSKLISMLYKRARQDSVYKKMGEEYAELEERFSQMVMGLSKEDQDLAWAYIFQGESMNKRMLEIICEEMRIWRLDLK